MVSRKENECEERIIRIFLTRIFNNRSDVVSSHVNCKETFLFRLASCLGNWNKNGKIINIETKENKLFVHVNDEVMMKIKETLEIEIDFV